MCFVLKFVFYVKNAQHLKIFLAGSKTQHLPRVKLSLFSKSRSLSSRRKNTSCHLVCLTALQQVGLWKKEIQRVSTKSNSLSGRKGCFHNNAGHEENIASEPRRC